MTTIHPLLRDEVDRPKIPTRPLERLADKILEALDQGRRGVNTSGRSGDGKTEGSVILANDTHWMPKPSPTLRIVIPHRTSTTDSGFYKYIQSNLCLTQHPFSTPLDRLDQIVKKICEECLKYGSKHFFLIIDQAQLLHEDDYHFLANIDDFLTMKGFRIICIFIRQIDDQSTTAKKVALSLENVEPNFGRRFFLVWHRYTGLAGLEDYTDALKRYGNLRFKGQTYLEEFAPAIYQAGGRLEDIAPLFVDAVATIRQENNLAHVVDLEIAMAIFEPTIVNLLTNTAARNPDFTRFELAHVKCALLDSGYLDLDRIRRRQNSFTFGASVSGRAA